MRVLVVFIDMIRPNRLSIINKNIKDDTPFDKSLKNLGGTLYNNCFTQGPDTQEEWHHLQQGRFHLKMDVTVELNGLEIF